MLKMETRFVRNLLWVKMTNQARFENNMCATNNNMDGL